MDNKDLRWRKTAAWNKKHGRFIVFGKRKKCLEVRSKAVQRGFLSARKGKIKVSNA